MSTDNIITRTYTGAAIATVNTRFRQLTREVFYDWPYLLQPNPSGARYTPSRYAAHPRAAVFIASVGEELVGAASCLPLEDEAAYIQAPFRERGWDLRRFFYFGEGVIRAPWRGIGLGVRFFALRESHARATSTADYTIFCSVRRPPDHPLRPADPVTNDRFWRARGYVPLPDVACTMIWRDRDEAGETPHTLDFWIKPLAGAPLP